MICVSERLDIKKPPRTKFLCLDASAHTLAFGSTQIWLFDRHSFQFVKLVSPVESGKNTTGHVFTHVKFSPSGNVLAAVSSLGVVHVVELRKDESSKVIHRVKEHKRDSPGRMIQVTALTWNDEGTRLFSGDDQGVVVCTRFPKSLFGGLAFASETLLRCDTGIVQLAFHDDKLLVSSHTRSLLVDASFPRESPQPYVQQVGKALRDGPFGACFSPGCGLFPSNNLFVARPGRRVWRADENGAVQSTLKLTFPLPPSPMYDGASIGENLDTLALGKLSPLVDLLCSWTDGGVAVIDSETVEVLHWCADAVLDLTVWGREVYVLRQDATVVRLTLPMPVFVARHLDSDLPRCVRMLCAMQVSDEATITAVRAALAQKQRQQELAAAPATATTEQPNADASTTTTATTDATTVAAANPSTSSVSKEAEDEDGGEEDTVDVAALLRQLDAFCLGRGEAGSGAAVALSRSGSGASGGSGGSGAALTRSASGGGGGGTGGSGGAGATSAAFDGGGGGGGGAGAGALASGAHSSHVDASTEHSAASSGAAGRTGGGLPDFPVAGVAAHAPLARTASARHPLASLDPARDTPVVDAVVGAGDVFEVAACAVEEVPVLGRSGGKPRKKKVVAIEGPRKKKGASKKEGASLSKWLGDVNTIEDDIFEKCAVARPVTPPPSTAKTVVVTDEAHVEPDTSQADAPTERTTARAAATATPATHTDPAKQITTDTPASECESTQQSAAVSPRSTGTTHASPAAVEPAEVTLCASAVGMAEAFDGSLGDAHLSQSPHTSLSPHSPSDALLNLTDAVHRELCAHRHAGTTHTAHARLCEWASCLTRTIGLLGTLGVEEVFMGQIALEEAATAAAAADAAAEAITGGRSRQSSQSSSRSVGSDVAQPVTGADSEAAPQSPRVTDTSGSEGHGDCLVHAAPGPIVPDVVQVVSELVTACFEPDVLCPRDSWRDECVLDFLRSCPNPFKQTNQLLAQCHRHHFLRCVRHLLDVEDALVEGAAKAKGGRGGRGMLQSQLANGEVTACCRSLRARRGDLSLHLRFLPPLAALVLRLAEPSDHNAARTCTADQQAVVELCIANAATVLPWFVRSCFESDACSFESPAHSRESHIAEWAIGPWRGSPQALRVYSQILSSIVAPPALLCANSALVSELVACLLLRSPPPREQLFAPTGPGVDTGGWPLVFVGQGGERAIPLRGSLDRRWHDAERLLAILNSRDEYAYDMLSVTRLCCQAGFWAGLLALLSHNDPLAAVALPCVCHETEPHSGDDCVALATKLLVQLDAWPALRDWMGMYGTKHWVLLLRLLARLEESPTQPPLSFSRKEVIGELLRALAPSEATRLLLENEECCTGLPVAVYAEVARAGSEDGDRLAVGRDILDVLSTRLWFSKKYKKVAPQICSVMDAELGVHPSEVLDGSQSVQNISALPFVMSGGNDALSFTFDASSGHYPLPRTYEHVGGHWGVHLNVLTGTCAICTLPLANNVEIPAPSASSLLVFPCGHAFHRFCLPEEACLLCFCENYREL